MGYLSNQTNGSRDAEIIELKTKLNGLQTAMVGMETMFPPTAVDGSIDPAWVPKAGQTLSRAAYPALWERVKNMGTYVTDSAWLALQSSSPNGAVSVYSSGDGSTTFRVPTVGEDGGFQRAVGTDPILNSLRNLEIGYIDQIQNITGKSYSWTKNSGYVFAEVGEGAFLGNSEWGNPSDGAGHVFPSATTLETSTRSGTGGGVTFDASRVARTGDETTPKGMYGKVYIYSGNLTTSLPTVTPTWLAQQDVNTSKIAENEARLNDLDRSWKRVGIDSAAEAGTFGSGVSYNDMGEGLKWRFVTADTIQVIGIARFTYTGSSMSLMSFPSEISNRMTYSQYAPATINILSSTTTGGYTSATSAGALTATNIGSGASWIMVNHTFVLDL